MRKGHIDDTKFSLPSRDWIWVVWNSFELNASLMAAIVFSLLSSGSFQLMMVVSNQIPKTFPFVVGPNDLSNSGHSGASWRLILSQIFLYEL